MIECSRCYQTGDATATESHFKCKNTKGKLLCHRVSYWLDMNLKLAMDTFVLGIGVSNMAQLLSFFNIHTSIYMNGRFKK